MHLFIAHSTTFSANIRPPNGIPIHCWSWYSDEMLIVACGRILFPIVPSFIYHINNTYRISPIIMVVCISLYCSLACIQDGWRCCSLSRSSFGLRGLSISETTSTYVYKGGIGTRAPVKFSARCRYDIPDHSDFCQCDTFKADLP